MTPQDDLRDQYYEEKDVADVLKISHKTLINKRTSGHGHPPYLKLGRRVLYPKKRFHDWLNRQVVEIAIIE